MAQDGVSSVTSPRPDFITWSPLPLGALDSFCAVGVLVANATEKYRAFLRKIPWHVSPAISMNSEEKPKQDYCIIKGETGPDICSSSIIFGKHIFIFNLHQIWSGAKLLQCVSSYSSQPGTAGFVPQIPSWPSLGGSISQGCCRIWFL